MHMHIHVHMNTCMHTYIHTQRAGEQPPGRDPRGHQGQGLQDALSDPDAVHPPGPDEPRRRRHRADRLGQDRGVCAAPAGVHIQARPHHGAQCRRGAHVGVCVYIYVYVYVYLYAYIYVYVYAYVLPPL